MRILLTGAFGSVGLSTIKKLLKQNYKVRCFDLKTKLNEKKSKMFGLDIEIIWGDIQDENDVCNAVKGQDIVIHLAFIMPPVSEQKPNWAWGVNVEGTRNLLSSMRKLEKPPKIIFASSVSVFGKTQKKVPPRMITDPVQPTDNYSHHKVACEQLVKISGLDWAIFRLGAVLSVNLCDIDPMLFQVPLDTRIELIHPDDIGLAFTNAVGNKEVWKKILLIGGGESCQIYQHEFVKKVLDIIGIGMLPRRAFSMSSFYIDWMNTAESQRILNYQQRSLDDFIEDIKRLIGFKRYLIRAIQPVIRYWLLKKSPYIYKKVQDKNKAVLKKKPTIPAIS